MCYSMPYMCNRAGHNPDKAVMTTACTAGDLQYDLNHANDAQRGLQLPTGLSRSSELEEMMSYVDGGGLLVPPAL